MAARKDQSEESGSGEGGALRAYRVEGRVQGVGFRWWTRKTAQDLGLKGSVRNCSDGSVEVHAAGTHDALEALEEALRDGPPMARVEAIHEVQPAPLGADVNGFTIDRS